MQKLETSTPTPKSDLNVVDIYNLSCVRTLGRENYHDSHIPRWRVSVAHQETTSKTDCPLFRELRDNARLLSYKSSPKGPS